MARGKCIGTLHSSAAKHDVRRMETALEAERTPGTVDADPGCDTAKEAPERRQREPEPDKFREFEMEM